MKLAKTLFTLGALVCLVGCNKPQDLGPNKAYEDFKSQSQTNEAKTQPFNKAVLTCSYVEVSGDRGIDNESYILENGVWTPLASQDYKDYLSIKGSALKDPIKDYKKMASEAAKKDPEAESVYSSGYSSSDHRCYAEFEITITSNVAGFHQYKAYSFNEYGLLTSYDQEETNKTKLAITIAYSVANVA